jgi:hypothetical protein
LTKLSKYSRIQYKSITGTYAEPGTHILLSWTKLANSRNIQNLPLAYVFQNKVSIKTLGFKPTNNSHGTACFHQNLHKVQTFETTLPIKFQIIKIYRSQITEHSHNIPQGCLTYSKSQYTETFAYTFPDEIKLELFKHQTIKSLWWKMQIKSFIPMFHFCFKRINMVCM